MPRTDCLGHALATQALLGVYGHHGELRIGVEREDGALEAHSWVEHEGTVLVGGDVDLARYEGLEA